MHELFVDKYRPTSLEDLDHAPHVNQMLQDLAVREHDKQITNVPHMIFKGNVGAGKRTRLQLYLEKKFGEGVNNVEKHNVNVTVANKKKLEMMISVSQYHYVLNPSVHGVYDRALLDAFITSIVNYKMIGSQPYRLVVIENADSLTNEAQQYLRRTLETKIVNCRFIFMHNNIGRFIDALHSRCSIIRVPSPSTRVVRRILGRINKSEGNKLTSGSLDLLTEFARNNLTDAMNWLQYCILHSIHDQIDIYKINRYAYNAKVIVNTLVKGKSLSAIVDCRMYVKNLLVSGMTCMDILQLIYDELLKLIGTKNYDAHYRLAKITSDHDDMIRSGGKVVYHIESYLLHLFKLVKTLMANRYKAKGK